MAETAVALRADVLPGARSGVRRALVLAMVGTTGALASASLVLAVFSWGSEPPAFEVHPEYYLADLGLALVYAPLGALVLLRSGHVVGWGLLLVGLGFGVTAFGIQYAILGVEHPGLPAYTAVAQLVLVGWVVGTLTGLLVIPPLAGRGAPSGRRHAAALLGLVTVGVAGTSRYLLRSQGWPPNPLTGDGPWAERAAAFDAWVIPLYFLAGLAGAVHLVVRSRQAPSEERRSLHWIAASVVLLACAYLVFETGLSLDGPLAGIGAAVLAAAQFMLLGAIFVLVVRQPSWDVDLAVSRTLVGALLSLAVVAAYLVLVWVGGTVIPSASTSVAPVVVGLLALAVMPGRAWLQRRVEHLVFGTTFDAAELLDRLGGDVEDDSPDATVLDGLARRLRHGLRLDGVSVLSTDGDLAVHAGVRSAAAVRVGLHSRGRQVGELLVSAPAGERLDVRTLRLIEQISGLVAVALDLAMVSADRERARRRLLDVRQEERRLLRRELHDSLGPSLAGTSLALAAIVRRSTLDPADHALIAHLRTELDHRADDVRQMARVMLPPALEDGRLSAALEVLAARFTQGRFQVTVDASGADELDSRHQVAIYHVAAEAVLNAFRHAGARRCHVALDRVGDGARLRVTDDGAGVAPTAEPGIGLSSMRERAGELGGTFEVDSGPAGTRITILLP